MRAASATLGLTMIGRSVSHFVIEPLALEDQDLEVIEAIDQVSFGESSRTDLRAELTRPFTHAWVARCVSNGASSLAAGFIVTWWVADELHILNIATSPLFRRKGAGRALMEKALGFAREHKVRLLVLEVRRSNRPAIHLYRSLGFSIMGLRPEYYADNGEDALEMILVLDPETGHIIPSSDELPFEEV